jgi:hypothetical protein
LGGVNVTENLTYGCLVQEEWACDIEERVRSTPFVCRFCEQTKLGYSPFKVIQHERFCEPNVDKVDDEPVKVTVKANSKAYHCDKCGKDLYLTPVETLKHKKSCN